MKLDLTVHTALDELRTQMLGTQVLFGFQFQGVFQEGFANVSSPGRWADVAAFGLLVVTIGCLLAPAAQHRLVERGVATSRLLNTTTRFAEISLATYAAAIGCDVFLVLERPIGHGNALGAGLVAFIVGITVWFLFGGVLRAMIGKRRTNVPQSKEPNLHEKIDQMLTESRVVLPGAQALLGFQFVVTMTSAFEKLPRNLQFAHFLALGCILLAVVLLIAPAAVHRIAFGGEDAERMHDVGSFLVTIALIPLAAGIACDLVVASARIFSGSTLGLWAGVSAFAVLALLWYALPFAIRGRTQV